MIKSGNLLKVTQNKLRFDSKVRTWSSSRHPSKKGHMTGIIDQDDVFVVINVEQICDELQILTKYGVGFMNAKHLQLNEIDDR